MTAAQFFIMLVGGVTIGLALTALSYRAEPRIRAAFTRARVAYDDAELARMVAEDEAAWERMAAVLRSVDHTPNPEPTPLYTETVLDNLRRDGGAA